MPDTKAPARPRPDKKSPLPAPAGDTEDAWVAQGARLEAVMKAAGDTNKSLGEKIGRASNIISRYCKGKAGMPRDILLRIYSLYGPAAHPTWILTGEHIAPGNVVSDDPTGTCDLIELTIQQCELAGLRDRGKAMVLTELVLDLCNMQGNLPDQEIATKIADAIRAAKMAQRFSG